MRITLKSGSTTEISYDPLDMYSQSVTYVENEQEVEDLQNGTTTVKELRASRQGTPMPKHDHKSDDELLQDVEKELHTGKGFYSSNEDTEQEEND